MGLQEQQCLHSMIDFYRDCMSFEGTSGVVCTFSVMLYIRYSEESMDFGNLEGLNILALKCSN